jgi:hypothetical protein
MSRSNGPGRAARRMTGTSRRDSLELIGLNIEAPTTGGSVKYAYWVLLVLAVALVAFGFFGNINWLIFVAIALILVAGALNPKRPFYGLRKNS